jgi:TatA/E family protein of Tat protein translocase
MHELDFQEIVVIFLAALVIFGPKKLPRLGEDFARALREWPRSMGNIPPVERIPLTALIPLGFAMVLLGALLALMAR